MAILKDIGAGILKDIELPFWTKKKDDPPAITVTEFSTKKWQFSERKWIEWKSDAPNELSFCNAAFVNIEELNYFIKALQQAHDHIIAIQTVNELAK